MSLVGEQGRLGEHGSADKRGSPVNRENSGVRNSPRRFRWPRIRKRQSPVADRFVARTHRRRRLRLLALFVSSLVIGGGVWVVLYSPWLSVSSVRVDGLTDQGQAPGSQQVLSAAGIPIGEPLARVDIHGIRQRVAALGWVASADVYRAWPNTVVVEVQEREPVAVLEEGNSSLGVDESGVIFEPPGGLLLTDPILRGELAAVAEAVKVVVSLPPEIERRVRVVQAVSPDDIRLELGNGSIVRWGNSSEAEFKAEVLLALLPRRAQAYDVSAPQLPATFAEKGPRN
jgi:cell division protein FtsQ